MQRRATEREGFYVIAGGYPNCWAGEGSGQGLVRTGRMVVNNCKDQPLGGVERWARDLQEMHMRVLYVVRCATREL
jgi:hypothetical protein